MSVEWIRRVPISLGMFVLAALLATTALVSSPASPVSADLPADGDDECEMQITKTNNVGGDVDEGDNLDWTILVEWDDDCDDGTFEVSDNIPTGLDVEDVDEDDGDGDIDCDSSDPIDCTGDMSDDPGQASVDIEVSANGDVCGNRTNTANLDWESGNGDGDDSDGDTVDVNCDGGADEDEDCNDENDEDEEDELIDDEAEEDEEDEDEEDENDDCNDEIVIVRRVPSVLTPQIVAALAPAPRQPTVVASAAPAAAAAPAQVQLPRAGEGPMQNSSENLLPMGASLLLMAGIGLVYLRLSRSR